MKKLLIAAALMSVGTANATVNVGWVPGAPSTGPVVATQTVVETFGAGADLSYVGAGPNGSGYGFLNGTSGLGAVPAFTPADGTRYLSVFGNGTFLYTLAAASAAFGFDIGSLDTYNRIIVSFSDGSTQQLDGAQIRGAATPTPLVNSGDQTIPATNGRVTYTTNAGDPLISSIRFSSITSNSFEVDRFSVGSAVPEATTWMMMILGFGFVAGSIRYRRRRAIATA